MQMGCDCIWVCLLLVLLCVALKEETGHEGREGKHYIILIDNSICSTLFEQA
jgi:hypothetical protein